MRHGGRRRRFAATALNQGREEGRLVSAGLRQVGSRFVAKDGDEGRATDAKQPVELWGGGGVNKSLKK